LYPGRTYKIAVDEDNRIDSFDYWIDEENMLSVKRDGAGFSAEKVCVEYEKRVQHLDGIIQDNLIASMGDGREQVMLALRLSDIFAWDIDFTSDLRRGDIYTVVVEGYYLNGEFRKYGDVLSAEFVNNGEFYNAYRFESNGEVDYFDAEGRSLKRAFLKAPLNFRRISSHFSHNRFHPILRIYRPHHGLDYSAPSGTPVSAVCEGTVLFSGYKKQYGNLVIIRHPNSWKTYYGHLSRIAKDVRKGRKVAQGQVIGAVGSTGLATGPHLHYELRIHNKPANPLAMKMPRGKAVPQNLRAEFRQFRENMDARITSIRAPYVAYAEKHKH
jgi:murein DD-endopeptidase MepM/ murein hydrolase activator NlpD